MFQEKKGSPGAGCLIVPMNSGWNWREGGQTPGGRSSCLCVRMGGGDTSET